MTYLDMDEDEEDEEDEDEEDVKFKLSKSSEKRLLVLSRRIRKSLEEVLEIARKEGCENPAIFVECEGPHFHVLDQDHPGYQNAGAETNAARQEAKLFTLEDSMPQYSDVGSW